MNELLSIKQRTAPNMEAYYAAAERFQEDITLLELRISDDLGIDVIA